MNDKYQTIGDLIDQQSAAFISSVDDKGFPNTKAMLPPRKREGIRTFYFTTNTSSMRVAQYRSNPKACIYFCDKLFFRGIMLKGTMAILEDVKSKEMIWLEGDTMYYPGRFYSDFNSEEFNIV
jgi:general stress protein 26